MKMGDKFDSEILSQIKEKKIKPKARWTFLLKDYVVWALGVISLFLGSVAVALIIYLIKNNDWDVYTELSGSLLEFIFLTMPYFWIVFLLIFIAVVNYNIKHTKKGYKFSLLNIFSVSVLASIVMGILLFNIGLGQALDDVLGENVSFYDTIINPRMRIWSDPEAGRLIGIVTEKKLNNEFQLFDRENKEWLINIDNAERPTGFSMIIGRPIKMIGEIRGVNYFVVEKVFIHNGPGRRMFMHRADGHLLSDVEQYDTMMESNGVCTEHCSATP